ncbi:MAG TPA: hypothetical protein VNW50_04290 [Streptosporangiaceae bacterium]|jgi:hypothetical protein|nr:hypothetical protein [Streptosporangiaceae bacterium]
MPADGVLAIDLACLRGSLRMSLPADRATVVAPAFHPAVCAGPEGPQAIPFLAAPVPTSPGGVR